MRRSIALSLPVLLSLSCRSGLAGKVRGVEADTGAVQSGGDDGDDGEDGEDGGRPDDTGHDTGAPASQDEAAWCLDWETGLLHDAGYDGDFVELWDGALVLVAAEGDEYSALLGEEALDYRGDRALVLRSSHDGRVDSTAIATTPLFDVTPQDNERAHLWWWTLSEVDSDGIDLYADLLDEDGRIVASLDLPVETGGFVPGLQPHHDPIAGFPEIVEGPGTPGELVQQRLDLAPFAGQRVRLRLYQHTRVPNNGFFTVFDDICFGVAAIEPTMQWGPPDPTH